jgi:hypothetical protein
MHGSRQLPCSLQGTNLHFRTGAIGWTSIFMVNLKVRETKQKKLGDILKTRND